MADATGFDLDAHLTGGGFRDLPLDQLERRPRPGDLDRLHLGHVSLLTVARVNDRNLPAETEPGNPTRAPPRHAGAALLCGQCAEVMTKLAAVAWPEATDTVVGTGGVVAKAFTEAGELKVSV